MLPNRVKVILLFRNNATRFYYKIQRRKFVIFSQIWGTRSTVKAQVTSKIRFDDLLDGAGGSMKNVAFEN